MAKDRFGPEQREIEKLLLIAVTSAGTSKRRALAAAHKRMEGRALLAQNGFALHKLEVAGKNLDDWLKHDAGSGTGHPESLEHAVKGLFESYNALYGG